MEGGGVCVRIAGTLVTHLLCVQLWGMPEKVCVQVPIDTPGSCN